MHLSFFFYIYNMCTSVLQALQFLRIYAEKLLKQVYKYFCARSWYDTYVSDMHYQKAHQTVVASHHTLHQATTIPNMYIHRVSWENILLKTKWLSNDSIKLICINEIADQKVALQEMLLHHQGNQANYAPNLLPSSPRTLTSSTDPMLLTHTVLTSHLTSGTPNIQSQQQQIGQTLVPLPHEHSPGNINTLYSSLQSAPKKRKLSQDGLVHVKQVQRVKFFFTVMIILK